MSLTACSGATGSSHSSAPQTGPVASATKYDVAWLAGSNLYVMSAIGSSPTQVPIAGGTPSNLLWSDSGRYLAIETSPAGSTGPPTAPVSVYDRSTTKLRSLACPADLNSSCAQMGFVGDTLAAVTENSPGRTLHLLTPGATTWSTVPILPVENGGSGPSSTPNLVFSRRGVLEAVSKDTTGHGPWGLYIIATDGKVSFVTTEPNDWPGSEAGGGAVPNSDNLLLVQNDVLGPAPSDPTHSSMYALSLTSGSLTRIQMPTLAADTFWAFHPEFGLGGTVTAWFEAQPISCVDDQSKCPDAPIVQYRLAGSTWQPTGVIGKSVVESSDGRIVVAQTKGSDSTETLTIDGRPVATNATLGAVLWKTG